MIGLLTTRLATLDKDNARQQADLKLWTERLPRVLLIESEYQLAMRLAQASWLRGLLGELVAGTISGMDGWRQLHETGEVAARVRRTRRAREEGVDGRAGAARRADSDDT